MTSRGQLNVTVATIYNWRRAGCGPSAITLSPRSLRWRQSDVDAWLADRAAEERAKHPPARRAVGLAGGSPEDLPEVLRLVRGKTELA